MKTNKTHARLYYLPGLISLVLLPLIIIPYIFIKSTPKPQYCLELNMPPNITYGNSIGEDRITLDMHLPIFERKYSYKVFSQKSKDNLIAIDEGIQKISSIQRNKDSLHGLAFVFKDVCFGDFIYLLSGLRKNKINLYLVFGDTVRTYYLPPAPIVKIPEVEKMQLIGCGTAGMMNLQRLQELELENEKHFAEMRWNYLKQRKRPLLILSIAYLALTFFACKNLVCTKI
ncbi:MAG: hypothetical protein CFE21_15405 [Bacteroidetes bacterium B1(2017)]|nr:MAG: hypothetical protein CFE21_15405 [Bacteroidetes bacterium B1(2017)]